MRRNLSELLIVFMVIGLLVALVYGAGRISYEPSAAAEGVGTGRVLMTSQIGWNILNTALPAGSDPNALVVGERTYLTLLATLTAGIDDDEKISYAHIPASWNGIRLRCRGYTNEGDVDYEIYLGTLANGLDCELTHIGQLAFVVGTQASIETTYEMADEVVVTTASTWEKLWSNTSPSGNSVATANIDLLGADLIVAVPITVDCNSRLIMKGY